MTGPLAGLRVLYMRRILAGPWAAQTFADLGAEVIKIERPGTGDDTRAWGPPFLKTAEGADSEHAAYFLSANRGKKSIPGRGCPGALLSVQVNLHDIAQLVARF